MHRDHTIQVSILLAALFGALLITMAYQIPVVHLVDIGGFDAGYVSGFFEPERSTAPHARSYLQGSDGSARWARAESSLLFPQAGLPAQITLRMRGDPDASSRSPNAPTIATILVNGSQSAQFRIGPEWVEQTIAITGGLAKPEDVLVTIRATTHPLGGGDARQVSLLLDQATLTVGPFPILPYPLQVMYAAMAGGLLAVLAAASSRWRAAGSFPTRLVVILMLVLALAFLLFYRMQPLYPWPLRGLLPGVVLGLAALVVVQQSERLARLRYLTDGVALLGIVGWVVALLLVAQGHLVLSVPGVEKDFRVFATRDTPATIFAADGFYNLGYPLLLWLMRPVAQDNPFLAARLASALSGGALLFAAWWLARRQLGAGGALVALAALALSPFVVQYGLYLGSDMPFAALCAWAVVCLADATRSGAQPQRPPRVWVLAAAGILAGLAFLVRHPGLVLLPLGWLLLVLKPSSARRASGLLVFTLAFVVTISPQLWVNLRDTGQILYSQQAKNIWLAVFGGGDWGRWGEASNDVALGAVVALDPGRFWENVVGNMRAFAGSGAEDTSEFGRAIQLRLLGFPANWLAVAGLLAWLWYAIGGSVGWLKARGDRTGGLAHMRYDHSRWLEKIPLAPLLWVLLYVPAIAVGFALPRFFLPLASIYALAAAWAVCWVGQRLGGLRTQVAIGLLLVALVWGGFAVGSAYVLRPVMAGGDLPGQPEPTLGVARLVLSTLSPGERVAIRIPADDEDGQALAKYSAIGHLVTPGPAVNTPEALRASNVALLVWSDGLGRAPEIGLLVGRVGPYSVWRIGR